MLLVFLDMKSHSGAKFFFYPAAVHSGFDRWRRSEKRAEPPRSSRGSSHLRPQTSDLSRSRVSGSPLKTPTDRLPLVSAAEVGGGLVWAGVRHHLEPRLVNDVQQVLGVDGERVSCRQHLLLVVLLEAETEETPASISVVVHHQPHRHKGI